MTRPRIAIPIPTSFEGAYNQRTWPQYATAVERSGGSAVSVALDDQAAAAEVAKSCQALLLPGSAADVDPARFGESRGPETADPDPKREAIDLLLLEAAGQEGKPVLTICFGTQMLNVWRGGSLIQHLPGVPVLHPNRGAVEAHAAEIAADSLLAGAVGLRLDSQSSEIRIKVNSSHHQAIKTVGDRLRIVARSPEDGSIEAVERSAGEQFLLGVQWHPERTYEESRESKAIFDRFVAEAQDWGSRPGARGSKR
jgi:putative glutamine amidotransferase